MGTQGGRDQALRGDLFAGLVFFHLTGLNVDIIDLSLSESRERRGADYGQRKKRNQ
jgi:hypothetical protein